MDRNIGVGLETQSHVPVLDPDHRDFDHALKAYRSSNHHRLVVFPRQHQHGIVSICVRIQKKPTWSRTLRHSTTSAYLLTSLPARPGCASFSLPITWASLYGSQPRKQLNY